MACMCPGRSRRSRDWQAFPKVCAWGNTRSQKGEEPRARVARWGYHNTQGLKHVPTAGPSWGELVRAEKHETNKGKEKPTWFLSKLLFP